MRAVVYSHTKSGLGLSGDALALRTGVLFASELCYAGHGYTNLIFEKYYTVDSLEGKIGCLMHAQHEGLIDTIADYSVALSILKNYKKKKGKSQEEIVTFKKTERLINQSFAELKNLIGGIMDNNGLLKMSILLDRGYFSTVCQIHNETEMKNESNNQVPMSEMLTLEKTYYDTDETINKDIPPVFFLPPEFLDDNKINLKAREENGIEFIPRYHFIESLFKLPNMINLSFHELESVRNQLLPLTSAFNISADEWIKKIYEGSTNTQAFLTENLLPLSAAIQEKLNNNEELENINLILKGQYQIEVFAGEALLTDIWSFYNSFRAISPDTMNRLNELKNQNEKYIGRFPFFTVKATKTFSDADSNTDETEINPVKKNLSLD